MLNKSLFNKALIRKDIKLISWVVILNITLLIMMLPFSVSQSISDLKTNGIFRHTVSSIQNIFLSYSFVGVFVSVIISNILFAFEKSTKSIEVAIHMPFSRKQIYFNKVLVGLLSTVIPFILIGVITFSMIRYEPLLVSLIDMNLLLNSFINMVSISLVTFSYYTMMSMIFGNSFASVIFGTIITFFPIAFFVMLDGLFTPNIVDIVNFFEDYTPIAILFKTTKSYNGYISLILFSILFLVVSYVLFEMTKMEKNSEVFTFKILELPFKIGFFICSVMLFSLITMGILSSFSNNFEILNKIIGAVIGAVIGYFLPKVLINRNKNA